MRMAFRKHPLMYFTSQMLFCKKEESLLRLVVESFIMQEQTFLKCPAQSLAAKPSLNKLLKVPSNNSPDDKMF